MNSHDCCSSLQTCKHIQTSTGNMSKKNKKSIGYDITNNYGSRYWTLPQKKQKHVISINLPKQGF